MQKIGFRLALFFICSAFFAAAAFGVQYKGVTQSKGEFKCAEHWVKEHLISYATPFFSFVYNGRKFASLPPDWNVALTKEKMDEAGSRYVLTFTEPKTKLIVRCKATVYADFPAVEWLLEFENAGKGDTPIIENIQAADVRLLTGEQGQYILHHARGSNHGVDDFAPLKDEIAQNGEIVLAPKGGRSSDETALPFFNIQAEKQGAMVAVGWTGQWLAVIQRDDKAGVILHAGMERTHLKLHAGEKIRMPRILLLFWQGKDRLRGHNLLRQFILAHNTPQQNGAPVIGPLACNGGAFMFNEFTMATEHNMIALAERYQQFGIQAEYWWIDAGWYGSMDWHNGGWSPNVGNWYVRKEHFPHGLKPVADAVNKMGLKLILWFEPERVFAGTWVDREHPEWVLKKKNAQYGIFNLGIPEAREWMTDVVSRLIEENGVALYRQDFNIRPLDYWRAADTPDRQGMTEIRHIEGLYAFWDELLQRHPGLIIDNCASGGRRLDLETISRSITLWRSDYNYTEPTGRQNHTYGLSLYLPYHGTGCTVPDMYVARSTYASSMVTGWNLYADHFPKDLARYIYDEYKKIRPYFQGDFYPLTEYTTSHKKWLAYQFHRRDLKSGIVLVFRRPQCDSFSKRIQFRGLSDNAMYRLVYEDSGAVSEKSGRELREGIEVTILQKPGSLLITYRQMNH
ncbi:MAG: alpha-galactosidase [Calditrichaeota bacterium]|nr:alpha-galactosidase [Calditrichota bacterium]